MDTGTLTTIALALIAVVAVLTVIGILWGAHLKRQRVAAERIEELVAEQDRKAAARNRAAPPTAAPAPPLPVAPPPPPLAPEPPVIVEPIADEPATEEPSSDPAPFADEPIAAAAPLEASPAAEAVVAAPAPAPPAPPVPEGPPPGDGPITQLKGLGPKLAGRLAELGFTTVGQLAALDAAQAEALDARLGPFTGRMNRDRWIEQARFLAAGDRAGFEAVFGKL